MFRWVVWPPLHHPQVAELSTISGSAHLMAKFVVLSQDDQDVFKVGGWVVGWLGRRTRAGRRVCGWLRSLTALLVPFAMERRRRAGAPQVS